MDPAPKDGDRRDGYRALFDASPAPMFVYDATTFAFVEVNRAALALYGYSRGAFLTRRVSDIGAAEGFTEAATESVHTRCGSTTIVVETTARATTFAGRPAVLVVVRDLSRRGDVPLQSPQAQKMEAIGRLAGGVAHDFNNVLSIIFGYVQFYLDDENVDQGIRDDFEEIGKAAERAATLTRQLLMFSRQQVVELQVVDPGTLVRSYEPVITTVLGRGIELVITASNPIDAISVDPSSFEQILLNLAMNARDAMPKGGRLTIESRNGSLAPSYLAKHPTANPEEGVLIIVSDTGVGMDPATMDRIFEPFFTTKENGRGAGLGLSSVIGLVEQIGGTISVASVPGRGTSFTIFFPRVKEPVYSTPAPRSPASPAPGTETILLVDDDQQVRAIAAGILERAGYKVLQASSGADAIRRYEAHARPIHLLLTDAVMPQMTGPELAARFSRLRPDMKLLCISGYTEDATVRQGLLGPTIPFLQKPFTPASLTQKVRAVLDAPTPGTKS